MALTITLTPEVEARLRLRAQIERRAPEELAAEWIAIRSEEVEAKIAENLRRFDEGIVRVRQTMGDQPPFPDYAYDRAFAYEE